MDAGFLNFHKEEDFSAYFLDPCEEDSHSYDGIQKESNYQWIEHLDYETELNGDMGLIPISGEAGFALSTSPPVKEDFNKIMNDWNNLVSLDVGNELVDDMASTSSTLHIEAISASNEELGIKEEGFDITKYIVGSEPESASNSDLNLSTEDSSAKDVLSTNLDSLGIHVKQEHFDMEMEFESECFGSITTNNLSSPELLNFTPKVVTGNPVVVRPQFGGKRIDMAKGRYMLDESSDEESDDEDIAIDVETVEEEEISQPVLQAGDLDSLLEQFEATETTNLELQQHTERVNYDDIKQEETELSLDIIVEEVKILSPIKSPVRPKVHPANRKKLDFREPDGIAEIKVKTEKSIGIVHSPHDKNTNHKHNSKKKLNSTKHTKSKPKCRAKIKDKSHLNQIKVQIKHEPQSPLPSPSPQREIDDPFANALYFDDFQVKVDRIVKSEQCDKTINCNINVEPTTDAKSPLIKDQQQNKQILEALPAELIDRLRQSNKRKTVPLIEPIAPIKRRHINNTVKDPITNSTLANRIIANSSNSVYKFVSTGVPVKDTKSIQLDHDYCCSTPTKDSGFSSCDEEDRSIVRTQPTIKSSNGKLMVSLLKTNTIKKKLNLEEYKKRLQNREGSGTPGALDDDENARRLKHTEMLMKMAQDIIKQRNGQLLEVKEALQSPQEQNTTTVVIDEEVKIKEEKVDVDEVQATVKPRAPRNIVMKTLVSMGTNTEESWGHLEQILQTTHIKISPNSLISSIVEHLPKPVIEDQLVQQGEDKTIVFIDMSKPKAKTFNQFVQTMYSSSHVMKFRRRRHSTSSSSSNTSSYSSDSDCSDGSIRGSRSTSPDRKQQLEQLKVVEERRVVYVGRIPDSITKDDLRKRFERFGTISKVSIHFRRRDVNYGFVTFAHKEDAYRAVEEGNDDKDEPEYDLSFGGRRLFCKTTYADLDKMEEEEYEYWANHSLVGMSEEDDHTFDELLRKAQAKLRKRKL